MINLSGEPSLGSMVLTRDGALKYTYVLPRGMTFPSDAEGTIVLTDRAGGQYEFSPYEGELSEDLTNMTWLVDSQTVNHVPSGANFEVFITYDDHTYKVRYGRVVRKEVSYPLNPLSGEQPALMYEDDLQRNMPGPHWITKGGAISMQGPMQLTGLGTGYVMGPRNQADIFGIGLSLFSSAAALWYAPLQSDSIEISAGIRDVGDGDLTIVFGSNYAMTDFVGVRILDSGVQITSGLNIIVNPEDTIKVVTGTAWNSVSEVGSGNGANYDTPAYGGIYKITYSPTDGVRVYTPGSPVPALTTSVAESGVKSGPGYRYVGVIFHGSLQTTGPVLYHWKVKDAV